MTHLQRLLQLCIRDSPSQRVAVKNRKVWKDNNSRVLEALYDSLDEEYPDIKQFALVLIKEMIEYEPALFAEHLSNFIHSLVEHYNDDVHICELTDEVLVTLANCQDRVSMLLILAPLILKEEPPSLQALIRIVKYVISRSEKYELDPILRSITEPLITTFNHPHANVRKSVVFCLVELYFVIGDSFEACLEELNPSQQKLV